MFQSLFLWNSLNGVRDGRAMHRQPEQGFNPCFCGIRSTAATGRPAPWATSSRFNPCFCGIRSTAISLPTSLMAAVHGFQSLFLWNSLNGAAWTDPRSSQ